MRSDVRRRLQSFVSEAEKGTFKAGSMIMKGRRATCSETKSEK